MRLVVLAEVMGCGAPSVGAFLSDGGASDARSDTEHVEPPYPDAGASPDRSLDASCSPGTTTNFAPVFNLPVGPYAGACTTSQLEAVVSDCFASTAMSTDCNKWVDDAKNAACVACALGPLTAATWAPVLYADDGAELFLNLGGCVALADPSQLTCAEAFEYATECNVAACLTACPIPPSGSTTAFYGCLTAADEDGGACATYADKAVTCTAALNPDASTSPASFCLGIGSSPDAGASPDDPLLRFLTLACGPAPAVDAGSPKYDGGSPHDGH